ncbi:hypothetical protein ACOSP7_023819 [Xanthoceras sorbifolium]
MHLVPHVCKLHKALYGLKQTLGAWFHKLRGTLLALNFTNSTSDISLFIKKVDSTVVYVLVYVDDILVTGSNLSLVHHTIKVLNSKCSLKTLGQVSYFLGFEAFRNSCGIYLTPTKYVHDLLLKTNMLNSKLSSTPICSVKLFAASGAVFGEPSLYRSVIGASQYLTYTRPDISFAVNKLSQYHASPTTVH